MNDSPTKKKVDRWSSQELLSLSSTIFPPDVDGYTAIIFLTSGSS